MCTQNNILNEILKCSNENLFETTFGDIMTNNDQKQNNTKKSIHQKCNSSILKDDFKNLNFNPVNKLDDIYMVYIFIIFRIQNWILIINFII